MESLWNADDAATSSTAESDLRSASTTSVPTSPKLDTSPARLEHAPPVVTPALAPLVSLVAAAVPPSSPKPASMAFKLPPVTGVEVEERGDELYLSIEDRGYRVRGLAKNTSRESLRINLLVMRGEEYFVDSFDLYLTTPRSKYERLASIKLGLGEDVLERDLGKILRKLEELQNARIDALLAPKNTRPEISPEDEAAAMEFLKDPKTDDRIKDDLGRIGVVGEDTNKVLAYLAAVSRKLPDPLAVIIQSSSAAGKTSLVGGVTSCFPNEEREHFSALTEKALYYMAERACRTRSWRSPRRKARSARANR